MGLRQRQWAARNVCNCGVCWVCGAKCAAAATTENSNLTASFRKAANITGKWIGHGACPFIFRQFRKGNLQLLCGGVNSCHGKKLSRKTMKSKANKKKAAMPVGSGDLLAVVAVRKLTRREVCNAMATEATPKTSECFNTKRVTGSGTTRRTHSRTPQKRQLTVRYLSMQRFFDRLYDYTVDW